MIKYRLFTKPELMRWRSERGLEEPGGGGGGSAPRIGVLDQSKELSVRYVHEANDDDVCAICAFDGDRMVGRLSILYFFVLVEGQPQRCCVGSNLMVLQEYRNSAVGLSILLKALGLGLPYFEASVSRDMRGIVESINRFHRVDESPIFQMGLDRRGVVQISMWDLYKHDTTSNRLSAQLAKLRLLRKNWAHCRKISRKGSLKLKVVSAEDAIHIVEQQFSEHYPVQVPWNRALLSKGLKGMAPDFGAWLVSVAEDSEPYRLITLYRRERVLGKDPRGELKLIQEAHLNEVYPPLNLDRPILPILELACRQAKARGASILHIHALTDALENTCRELGFSSHSSRTVFVAPGNIPPEVKEQLIDASRWWCRAFNEDQFTEVGPVVPPSGLLS